MKSTLLGVIVVMILAGMLSGLPGCVSDQRTVKTAADTQPRPYIDTVTNPPQQQPGLERTGTINH